MFCFFLNLIGRRHLSMPGIYIGLSLLPTLTLLVPGLVEQVEIRVGYIDYLIAILAHTFFICIGLALSYLMFNFGKIPKRNYSKFNFKSTNSTLKLKNIILFIAILSFFHQIFSLDSIPFLLIFKGSVTDLTMARESGYKLHGGIAVYIWHFSRMVFIPFLVSFYFLKFLDNKTKKNAVLFIVVLVFGMLNNALSGAKAPVAMLFLILVIIHFNLVGKMKIKNIFYSFLLILSFPFFVEYLFSESGFIESLTSFLEKFVNRFTYETFDRTLFYFDLFPYQEPYLGGRTNSLFTTFTGLDYFNVQNFVFIFRLESIQEHLLYGYANAHFIGYMNSDFGIYGVAFSCFFIGLAIGFIDVYSSKVMFDNVTFSLYIIIGFIFWKLMGSQPTTVLFSHGAILAFLMLIYLGFNVRKNNECNKTI